MRAWLRSTLLSLLFGLVALLLAPGAAWAATIVVTTTADENGGAGGTGCALREAIMTANVDINIGGCVRIGAAGADTITLQDSADYTLSIPNVAGDENASATGDLDVVGLLTIQVPDS